MRTEDGNGTASPREDGHTADILLGEGVLNGGYESASAGRDHGGLDGTANGILWLIRPLLGGCGRRHLDNESVLSGDGMNSNSCTASDQPSST